MPEGGFAKLTKRGTTYTRAYTQVPTDSFPGLLSLVTGVSPLTVPCQCWPKRLAGASAFQPLACNTRIDWAACTVAHSSLALTCHALQCIPRMLKLSRLSMAGLADCRRRCELLGCS
jgi:Type I phosphodiesterase / nucleotide pyrophosphatase